MSQLKLTADSGGGTVAIKGPASTTGNAAIDLTVPGTASATLDTLKRAGNILQVVSTTKTDTFSVDLSAGGISGDITGLTVSITPSNASNKILISFVTNTSATVSNRQTNILIYKDGSAISGALGAADGNKSRASFGYNQDTVSRSGNEISGQYLDTAGGTNAITYSLRLSHTRDSSYNIFVNRAGVENDDAQNTRLISTITVMEVAA